MEFLKSKLFNRSEIAKEMGVTQPILWLKTNNVQWNKLLESDIKKLEKVKQKMLKILGVKAETKISISECPHCESQNTVSVSNRYCLDCEKHFTTND